MEETKAAFLSSFRKAVGSSTAQWVEWIHVQRGKTHCETCLKLDGCWFMDSKKPTLPQHNFCHCKAEPLSYKQVLEQATADSDIRKFSSYLFNKLSNKPKYSLFSKWGYTVEDSEDLKNEFLKQATEKYANGEYTLGLLNRYGQRISIRIVLKRKDTGEEVSFISGWMIYPDGKIQLTTPYGGK